MGKIGTYGATSFKVSFLRKPVLFAILIFTVHQSLSCHLYMINKSEYLKPHHLHKYLM